MAEPIGNAKVVVVDMQQEPPISQAEIDLLFHWCGDLLAKPNTDR